MKVLPGLLVIFLATSAWAGKNGVPVNDGFAGAPAGAAPHPTWLNGYPKRPPWHVAGVDYNVGVPSTTTLVKWDTLFTNATNGTWTGGAFGCDSGTDANVVVAPDSTSGTTIAHITVGSSATITCFDSIDFSRTAAGGTNTGATLTIQKPNFTINRSQFGNAISTCCFILFSAAAPTFTNSTIDGSPASNITSALVYFAGGGNFTAQYNWIKNFSWGAPFCMGCSANALGVNGGTLDTRWNLFEKGSMYMLGHLNLLNRSDNSDYPAAILWQFNTMYQEPGVSGGEGPQFYNNPSLVNAVVNNGGNPQFQFGGPATGNMVAGQQVSVTGVGSDVNGIQQVKSVDSTTAFTITAPFVSSHGAVGQVMTGISQNINLSYNTMITIPTSTIAAAWQANHTYNYGDMITAGSIAGHDASIGFFAMVQTASNTCVAGPTGVPATGTSGSSAPNFSTLTNNQTGLDNTACWEARQPYSVSYAFHGPTDPTFQTINYGTNLAHDNWVDVSGLLGASAWYPASFPGFSISNNVNLATGGAITYP